MSSPRLRPRVSAPACPPPRVRVSARPQVDCSAPTVAAFLKLRTAHVSAIPLVDADGVLVRGLPGGYPGATQGLPGGYPPVATLLCPGGATGIFTGERGWRRRRRQRRPAAMRASPAQCSAVLCCVRGRAQRADAAPHSSPPTAQVGCLSPSDLRDVLGGNLDGALGIPRTPPPPLLSPCVRFACGACRLAQAS